MFGSTVLDVAIGLIFVFFMVSLVCSEAANRITQWLNWRADFLEKKIREWLMNGDQTLVNKLYATPWIKALTPRGEKPVNIPTKTFALAVFDAFVPNAAGITTVDQLRAAIAGLQDGTPMKNELLAWLTMVGTDMTAFRVNIENWFNAAEAQMTQVYRQNMWKFALGIGAIVSLVLNVDAVAVGNSLWRDSALRQAVVTAASQYATKAANATDPLVSQQNAQKAVEELNKLNLPIGWNIQTAPFSVLPNDWAQTAATKPQTLPQTDPLAYLLKLIGWGITALAGAQGAPFWFDLLKKVTQRN